MRVDKAIFVLVFSVAYLRVYNSKVIAKFTNVKCHGNPLYAQNVTCSLIAHGRLNVTSKASFVVLKDLPTFMLHFQFFKFYNQYRPFLIDVVVDACKLLDNTYSSFYTTLVRSSITETNVFNNGCPFVANHYYTNRTFFDSRYIDRLPDMSGKYRADLTFQLADKTFLWKISYSLDFVDKNPLEGNRRATKRRGG